MASSCVQKKITCGCSWDWVHPQCHPLRHSSRNPLPSPDQPGPARSTGPRAFTGPQLNSSPCSHAALESICRAWAPGTSGRSGNFRRTSFTKYCPLPIQLLLALRLEGPPAQFFAIPTYCPGRDLQSMHTGNFAGEPGNLRTGRIRRRSNVFWPYGSQTPRSILRLALMLPRTSFSRQGPRGNRGD